jgi:rod shape determining protein RodA
MSTITPTRPVSSNRGQGKAGGWTSARTKAPPRTGPRLRVDYTLLLMTAGLCTFGLIAVYSVDWKRLHDLQPDSDMYQFVRRQALFMGIGAVGMFAVMMIDYRRLRAWVPRFFIGTCGMLALLPLIGTQSHGIKAWYTIGTFLLQPSEFAKVTLVLALSAVVANDRDGPLSYARFVASLLVLAAPIGLIMLQPDLGTASTFVVVAMGILLVGRARVPHIALISAVSIISVIVLVSSGALASYQVARLTSFIKPQAKDVSSLPEAQRKIEQQINGVREQVRFSQQAVSLGGLHGQGFAQGPTMNGGYVSEKRTDFIFAAMAEQFGLIGMVVLLGLYLLMLFRLLRVAHLASDGFGALIASGAAALFVWHIFENVGMNMGIMPVTGIPLPLISYGGSSTVAFLLLLGFVQNVYRHREGKTS